ncbi:MAG: DNA adenine methylase [Actinomycetota bacterium]|nr:DNA adenine methylase [Actinomycetota bacterium]
MAYYGGKTRLADRIVALLPAHDHYVEPFAGSLAVLLAKRPSRIETVNDRDQLLMAFWQVLRDKPTELARACALTPHSRAEYRDAQAVTDIGLIDELDEVEKARLVWLQIAQGRTGTLRKTGWRYYIDPAGTTSSMPTYLDAYVDRMAAAAERLHRVSLECRPGIEVVQAYGAFTNTCLYVDPPYLGSTRLGRNYRTEMTDRGEHVELLDALLDARASVVLSGYANDLYDTALAHWDRIEISTATGQGGTHQLRTEVIWSNRPISQPGLFDINEGTTA